MFNVKFYLIITIAKCMSFDNELNIKGIITMYKHVCFSALLFNSLMNGLFISKHITIRYYLIFRIPFFSSHKIINHNYFICLSDTIFREKACAEEK